VFKRFVRDHIPDYISLGDTEQLGRVSEFGELHQLRPDILDAAVNRAITLLMDHDLEGRWANENFTALSAFCGMDTVAAEYIREYTALVEGL
jgi:hypothetical protein